MSKEEKRRSRTGLIVLIVLLILIGIPVGIIVLLQPGSSRWNRITAEAVAEPAKEIDIRSNSIFIHESWIEKRINDGIKLVNEESPEIEIAGVDLTLEKNTISLLAGVILENPVSEDKTIKAAVEASMTAFLSNTSELTIQIESVTLGRLPIPVKLITKIQALKSSLNTDNILKGKEAEFDLETLSLTINLDDLLNEVSPGSQIQNFQILEDRIALSISLSPEINREIQLLASELQNIAPDVHNNLIEKLPAEKTASLELASALYKELAEKTAEEEKPTVSYLEGTVTAMLDGTERLLDFGDIIEEKSTVTSSKNSYAEIILPGSSVLKILENSQVIIHSSVREGETEKNRLELTGGKLRAVVARLDTDADEFIIDAGVTTMGVRGTDFIIDFNKTVKLTVLEGAVAIENKESMALVEENQSVTAGENQNPEPVALDANEREKLLKDFPVYTDPASIDSLLRYNPAPSLFQLFTIYTDFYLSLTEEEQEEVELIVNQYIEENPEVMREITLFAEEQGWTEEMIYIE